MTVRELIEKSTQTFATEVVPQPPRDLHIFLLMEWPVALCGFRSSRAVPNLNVDTRGKDRCAKCMAEARRQDVRLPR